MKKNTRGFKLAVIALCTVVALFMTAIITLAVYLTVYKPPREDDPSFGIPEDNGAPGGLTDGEVYNILVIGHDRAAMLADVCMLVNYNVKEKSVAVLQIPRDTYVGDVDAPQHKLNTAYLLAYSEGLANGESDPRKYAAEEFEKLISKNLCVNINFTVSLDLEGFVGIVDAIGGVEIDVPFDMVYVDDAQDLTINIRAGRQTLDGKTAEGFVRFRAAYVQADIGRTNAQKLFMTAFLQKVKSSLDVNTVVELAKQAFKYTSTDMGLDDCAYFAKNILSVDLGNMTMMTAPGDGYGGGYVLNRAHTLAAINKYFNLYENDVSAEVFDYNSSLCDMSDAEMLRLYYGTDPSIKYEYSGDDAANGDVSIPLM